MKEYAISFRLLKSICKHVQHSTHALKTRHNCGIKSDLLELKDYKKHIKCIEVSCPILNKCDELIE